MKYLLVGNGPVINLEARSKRADVIVQINGCQHADKLPASRQNYIFLTNTGELVPSLVDQLYGRRKHIPYAQVILARNPLFNSLKGKFLPKHRRYNYKATKAWNRLCPIWPVETISFLSNLLLDLKLVKKGMPPSFMPSTGMIAYDWIYNRLNPGDSVELDGFTFEGWEQHAWEIEKELIKSTNA